jgi:hypothetical protein
MLIIRCRGGMFALAMALGYLSAPRHAALDNPMRGTARGNGDQAAVSSPMASKRSDAVSHSFITALMRWASSPSFV